MFTTIHSSNDRFTAAASAIYDGDGRFIVNGREHYLTRNPVILYSLLPFPVFKRKRVIDSVSNMARLGEPISSVLWGSRERKIYHRRWSEPLKPITSRSRLSSVPSSQKEFGLSRHHFQCGGTMGLSAVPNTLSLLNKGHHNISTRPCPLNFYNTSLDLSLICPLYFHLSC